MRHSAGQQLAAKNDLKGGSKGSKGKTPKSEELANVIRIYLQIKHRNLCQIQSQSIQLEDRYFIWSYKCPPYGQGINRVIMIHSLDTIYDLLLLFLLCIYTHYNIGNLLYAFSLPINKHIFVSKLQRDTYPFKVIR